MNPVIYFNIKSAYRKQGRQALIRKSVLSAITHGQPALLATALPAEISVVLSNDAHLHELNLAFRGYDKPTDVLSFEGTPVSERYLGDVIISMQQCALNAAKAHHTEDDELALLVVHGTLHLVGYDHMNKSDKARMWLQQKRALKAIHHSPGFRLPR